MIRKLVLLVSIIAWSFGAWAGPSHYHEMFETIRDENQTLTEIRIRKNENVTFQTFVQQNLMPLIVLQSTGKLSEANLKQQLQLFQYGSWSKKQKSQVRKALSQLNNYEFSTLLASNEFRKFFQKTRRLSIDLTELRRSVARPNEPLYFYNQQIRDIFYEEFTQLISDVFLGGVAGRLVAILVDRYFDSIERRTAFYQNALLHYTYEFEPEELGLTPEELMLVQSSIFDGRLSWYNLSARKSAKFDWQNFGRKELFKLISERDQKLAEYLEQNDPESAPVSLVFSQVQHSGSHLVLNFDNNAGAFDKEPSLAVDFSDLNKVFRGRVVLDILCFALEFLPAPHFIIEIPQKFLEKKFVDQIESEGALFSAYKETQNEQLQSVILMQTLNPLIQNAHAFRALQSAMAGF